MTPKRWQVEAEKLVDDVLFAWAPLIEKPEHKRLRDRLILKIASALSRLEAETVARYQQEGGRLGDPLEQERRFTQRLREWQASTPRQSAILAFTAGTLRQAARCIEEERQAACAWRQAEDADIALHHASLADQEKSCCGEIPEAVLKQEIAEAIARAP